MSKFLSFFSHHPSRSPRIWTDILLRWQGSVIPAIASRVLVCMAFSLGVTLVDGWGYKFSIPIQESIVPSIVLGLLLVFRTNTAYERFWEGRKAWGTMVNTIRNLSRIIWVSVAEPSPQAHQDKIKILHLLVAFAVATKLHLRSQPLNEEIWALLPESGYRKLEDLNNPPLEIAFWISNYLQREYDQNNINAYQLTAMLRLVDTMVDVLGSCERILKTPIPLAYAIHLRQLIFLYCFITPFQIVNTLHWATAFVVGIIAFTVFGIEEIGVEIENPFGHDANDLPLDQICQTMQANLEDLIQLPPWHQISHGD
ncbi:MULTISPECIES: bestrophin family protein [unclassified Synechocystis]|uniref:bestrophin family protein n=1 Tax=unclassified Synechocystis TaxID=2640012 RepID=UPI0002EA4BD9|nr:MULTISPECIES: bestrophin family protein [unclassified Synechocystis]UOO12048.1 bestrophin family protein [Synechocystis sp. PCC 6803]